MERETIWEGATAEVDKSDPDSGFRTLTCLFGCLCILVVVLACVLVIWLMIAR